MTTQSIHDPEGGFRIWHKREIYTGPTGDGINVPNIDDVVVEFIDNTMVQYRVTDVNLGNFLSTLVPLDQVKDNSLPPSAIALGVGPGTANQMARAYLDKRSVPYSLAVDGRHYVYGSHHTHAKIFAGTDLSPTGRVISAVYDGSGDYVGEDVPLEVVATAALNNNVAVKVLPPCKTSANLVDNEVLTIVYYDTVGNITAKEQVLVENTSFIRRATDGVKTVVGVGLVTPFLSMLNAKTIVYPRNITLQPENLTGVVYYDDGTELPLPVDGERFSVTGLDAYDSTVVGMSYPLVLKYELSINEQAYGGVGGASHVSETFTLTTAEANRAYEVRLFVYPKWVSDSQGYRLTWYLYDASRSIGVDVSSLVELTSDSAALSPKAYGVKQTLKAKINLANVAGNYNSFVHVQEVDVRLMAPGTFRQNLSTPPNWYVTPVAGHTPLCGGGVFGTFVVVAGSTKTFELKGNFSSFDDWKEAYYENALPLVITPSEEAAPDPTHFVLVINGAEFSYPITSWNQPLTISASCSNNDTIYVRFQYAGQQMLELAAAGMPLYQKNSDGSYV